MDKIRIYKEKLPLPEAADQAVNECIAENILAGFLKKHRGEVKNLILTEYDEQKTMNAFYEDGREEGIDLGLKRGICAFIKDNLEEEVCKERIMEKLKTRFHLSKEKAEEYFCKAIK